MAAKCTAFLRPTASPQAALVFNTTQSPPADWPTVSGIDAANAQLGHALGWVCEIRADAVVVLNPLGEGVYRAKLPALDEAWLHQARSTESVAIYLVAAAGAEGPAEALIGEQAQRAPIPGATVRAGIVEGFGAMPTVGRNEPCPCGSGRKYKKCHGAGS